MSNCLTCGKELTAKKNNINGNKKKYCDLHCRNVFYYKKRGGAEAQRVYLYKRQEEDTRPKIKCAICGKSFRQVGTHIVQVHRITARMYREEFGFDVKKGQLPEDYHKLKGDIAKENGTERNLIKGKEYWFEKGDSNVGRYERSDQTKERLKILHTYNKRYEKRPTTSNVGQEVQGGI